MVEEEDEDKGEGWRCGTLRRTRDLVTGGLFT
jgi:hypothetical protein